MHPVGTDSVLLGAWAAIRPGIRRILDIGTGTGAIALFLAQRTESFELPPAIFGVEVDLETARYAAENFGNAPWPDRMKVIQTTIQEFEAEPFDLIVSNPPFFSSARIPEDPRRRLGRHTASLSPGELIAAVNRLLAADGIFCAVLPPEEGRRLQEFGAMSGLYCTALTEVFTRCGKPVERFLLQFERNPMDFRRQKLLLFDENGTPAPEWHAMTKDFYLG